MGRFCFVGAGFSSAVLARAFAEAGHRCLVIDERSHIGGNCHTETDGVTGVLVHVYGPHIFHTSDPVAWTYIQRFGRMLPYINRVKAIAGGRVYTLPINLLTINQFFGKTFRPEEASDFLAGLGRSDIESPANFEEQALKFVGDDLYKTFFYGYTRKQWGCEPSDLPASILKRLPIRFNYDDNYFNHMFQGMPENGYSKIIANILACDRIEVSLNQKFETVDENFSHVFYSGPLDRYFNYRLGRLGYRTLDFEPFRWTGDYQGAAVVNYCDIEVPYTRITEHKHFAPWSAGHFSETICFREYSRSCGPNDTPYYPLRLVNEQKMLADYVALANSTAGVTFVGRLGTYRYLDMDVTISEALSAGQRSLDLLRAGQSLPTFFVDPVNH